MANKRTSDGTELIPLPIHLVKFGVTQGEWNSYYNLTTGSWKMIIEAIHTVVEPTKQYFIREQLPIDMKDFSFNFQTKLAKVSCRGKSLCFRKRNFSINTAYFLLIVRGEEKLLVSSGSLNVPTTRKPYNFQNIKNEQLLYTKDGEDKIIPIMYFKASTSADDDVIKFFEENSLNQFIKVIEDKKELKEKIAKQAAETKNNGHGINRPAYGVENDELHVGTRSLFTTSTAFEETDPYEVTEIQCDIPSWILSMDLVEKVSKQKKSTSNQNM